MLTQKYKQQQQQVRVISNESGYAKGMYYTDFPLSEGYAKILLNFNIDASTGKLTPRKGVQSLGVVRTAHANTSYSEYGRNILAYSKVCYNTSVTDSRRIDKVLQSIAYNPKSGDYNALYCKPEYQADDTLKVLNLTKASNPYIIEQPEIHNKKTVHNAFFKKPIGTFAFGNSYYTFLECDSKSTLCYTKQGIEIQPDETLLDTTLDYDDVKNSTDYYVCMVKPAQNNPTEATSWGYNMLLEDPYAFVCERTAVNLVTITGILPYSKNGELVLTPQKNQEVTLKGYYRAPDIYVSDTANGRYYGTAKKDELIDLVGTDAPDLTDYSFGNWCIKDEKYYMVMPAGTLDTKKLALYGNTKPSATVKLNVLPEGTDETEIRVHWQMKTSNAATWTTLSDDKFKLSDYAVTHGALTPFMVTTTISDTEVLIKLTISDPLDKESEEEYILSTNTIGISTVSDELANTLNLTPKKYDLSKCTGMLEWEQRLIVWGVPNALNTIFISEVNNPGFFPYPNNIDTFADPIISVHNYGNELLVLTTTSLYRLTWSTDGTGWTHTLVQRNLHIKGEDTYLSCVIKNMFFFKSNEYYYMMVPKSTTSASVSGETSIAPISKPIENLLDNFHEIVYNLIKEIVDQPYLKDFTDNLVNYFSYVDNTKVVVNYVYDLDYKQGTEKDDERTSKYLYVQLIYDTDARTWSLQTFEAAHMLYISHTDVIQQDHFIDITPILDTPQFALQFYKLQGFQDKVIQFLSAAYLPQYNDKPLIKNYQYLDTGNRELNTELKKRFREFQFKIKNNSLTNLQLYNGFYIDGSIRQDIQQYRPHIERDPVSGENVIIVDQYLITERPFIDAGELQPTVLKDDPTNLPCWTLDQSAFPGRTLWKIRIPITGKGYSPRAVLLSKNEEDFELLGHSWVYRTMNAR